MSILVGATSACAGAAGQSGAGFTIDQSLRFRAQSYSSGSYLHKTGWADSGNVWTFSCWVKGWLPWSYTTAQQLAPIFSWHTNASGTTVDELFIFGNYPANGRNEIYQLMEGANGGNEVSNQEFNDPAAWYHIVWKSSSVADVDVYVNGVQVTDWRTSSGAFTSQNFVNKNCTCSIGARAPGNTSPSNAQYNSQGYMAAVYFIDGTALDPTDFGKYNEDGVWVPIEYTGSYGTNGFHLTFDSSQTNGIGHDSSGNGNNFTATGFDTAAISSSNEDNDIDYNDTPTNNYTTLNPLHNRVLFGSGLTFEQGNLRAQYGDLGSNPGGFTQGFKGGKFYWEVTPKVQVELDIGLVSEDYDPTNDNQQFGETANGWAWRNSATSHHNGTAVDPSHTAFGVDDTIGILVDTDAGTAKIEVNGAAQSSSEFTNIPTDKLLFPALRLGGGSGDANAEFNFGQMPFVHTQSGYNDLATNNYPEPTIKNGKEHFNILTWTGTGSSNALTGLGFQPDLVWVKKRGDTAESHDLQDVIRGAGERLRTNSLDGSRTISGSISSFDSDGFTVVDAGTTNESGKTYVGWCWKAGGTAVSNTDGTITSSVSANTDAGFSIISYTGNGTGGATIGHGLNSAPEWIIVKRTAIDNSSWYIYHASVGNQSGFNFNTSAQLANSSGYWNNTSPTNQVISLGNFNDVNGNTNTLIAYAWHSVEGYSKFGSYVGNGDADGPFIYTGFAVSWLMVKRATGGTGNWHLVDAERDTSNPTKRWLEPNEPAAEQSNAATQYIDFLSNGFKVRGSGNQTNASTSTYVYIAFAESPFGGENAPPATAR
nr:hypothetical protein [uncultured Mediterranean phage uvMED]